MPDSLTLRIRPGTTELEPVGPTACVKPRPFGIGRFGVGLYSRYQPGEWPLARACEAGTWDTVEPCGCDAPPTSPAASRRRL